MSEFVRAWQRELGVKADGIFGAATLAASMARVSAKPEAQAQADWPRQADVTGFFGPAGGRDCMSGSVSLPFDFPLAWDEDQRLSRFSCHVKVAAPLTSIFAEAAKHYGEAEFRRLRLDRFGGCYNYRQIRGGASLSMHAWGIAVDLDPERNQLKWASDKASFARPEYAPFWSIVEAHGAVSLGRTRNFDWMHFQFARL
jgi:hypothetical protein